MIKLANERDEKKRVRKLTDIDVDEITLTGSTANRKTFFIQKADKEILAAVKEFLDGDSELEDITKAVDGERFLAAIREVEAYKDSLPDDLKAAIDSLLIYATKNLVAEEEVAPEKDVKKEDEEDPGDPWPSVMFPAAFEKMDEEDPEDEENPGDEEPEEDEEPEDEDDHDPIIGSLRRIEKRLAGNDEPTDLWPSLDPITPGAKIPVVKAEPIKKRDPDEPQKAISKQIQSDEGSHDIKKVDEIEDKYPSLPDSLFERS